MKKRTLLYALAVLFLVSGIYGIGQISSEGPAGTIGCLLIGAALFYWGRRTDPNIRIHRRRRAKSTGLSDYTAIDLETTGLSTTDDRIIELGAVRMRKGKPVATYSQLIDPQIALPGKITELTGITSSMLQGMPVIKSELPKFFAFIGNDMILGHNVKFDLSFLRNNADRLGIRFSPSISMDTMSISQDLFPDMPRHRLVDLIRRLGVADTESHRAADDAMQTAQCYEIMRQNFS